MSSIFLSRIYAIYKCALVSEKITTMLIKYYNIIIEEYYYLECWLSILDVMIEKVKGPTLG